MQVSQQVQMGNTYTFFCKVPWIKMVVPPPTPEKTLGNSPTLYLQVCVDAVFEGFCNGICLLKSGLANGSFNFLFIMTMELPKSLLKAKSIILLQIGASRMRMKLIFSRFLVLARDSSRGYGQKNSTSVYRHVIPRSLRPIHIIFLCFLF